MRSVFASLIVSAALALASSPAFAHSALTGSDPVEGGTVSAAGFPVELRFNGRMDAVRSRLVLTLADGSTRKLAGKANGPSAIVAQAEAVPPGRCALRYDVVSSDGHLTSGTITFTAAEH